MSWSGTHLLLKSLLPTYIAIGLRSFLHDNSQFYNIVNCVEGIFKVSFQHCQIYNMQIHPLLCKDLKVSGQWSVDWLVIVLTPCLDIFRLNNKIKQHKRAIQKPNVFKVCFSFKLQGWLCLHFKRCLWINISLVKLN